MAIPKDLTWEKFILQVEETEGMDKPKEAVVKQVKEFFKGCSLEKPWQVAVPSSFLPTAGQPTEVLVLGLLHRVFEELDTRNAVRKQSKLNLALQASASTGSLGSQASDMSGAAGGPSVSGGQPLALSEAEMASVMAMMGNNNNAAAIAKFMAASQHITKLKLEDALKVKAKVEGLPHHLYPSEQAVKCMWADTCMAVKEAEQRQPFTYIVFTSESNLPGWLPSECVSGRDVLEDEFGFEEREGPRRTATTKMTSPAVLGHGRPWLECKPAWAWVCARACASAG